MRMRFVSIFISNEDQAIDFYEGKLGFKLLVDQKTPFGGRFLMFQPPGGGTKLVMTPPMPGQPGEAGSARNIAFEVDENVEALYEQLKAKGVEFLQPPAKSFWGGVEARFVDPDGNSFLLQQGGM